MNQAWLSIVICGVLALPATASAQFGGGAGPVQLIPPPPKVVLEFEKVAPPNVTPFVVLDPAVKQSLTKVVAALDKSFGKQQFFEAPLSEVVHLLQKASGVRMVIDERALADASIGTDTLINLAALDAPLRVVLDSVCEPHGLGWLPGKDGLIITTDVVRDDTLLTVIYPVADLAASPDGDDYEDTIDLIQATLHPDSWQDQGSGKGRILSSPATGAIVVSQAWHVHEKIGHLLQGLRETKTQQGIRGLRKYPSGPPQPEARF